MDTQSPLCLGMHSNGNGSSATRTPIADDSISLQISSSCRDPSQSASSSVALQFLEQQPHNHNHNHSNRDEDSVTDGQEEEEDVKDEEEEFSILGHSVCLKRRRDADSSSATSKKMMNESSLEARRVAVRSWGNQPLCVADPVIFEIMEKEKHRQVKGIELIASENFVCRAVMEALGSHLTNKYSEGMPGARYYGGNQYIDQIELLCCKRALEAFHLDSDKWGVNVQPYSCTSANFAVYTGLLNPKDRIMGLDTPSGGHLSHGYYTPSGKKVAAAAIFFESLPYKVNPNSGYIDYDKLEENALNYRPKILICGGSSYPREWDYARFRQIADKCGAVLMCDMAHISGLVAAKVCISPFDYCDIVTSTTHKSLRGPRGGIVFFRKGLKPRKRGTHLNQCDEHERYDFEEKISFAVFPSLQGGPHNNHIAALAIALKQVATPEYHAYMQQVKKNAQALACALIRRKCRLVTGGTDNHLVLWDLRTLGLTVSAGRFSVILAPSESFGVDISTPDQCVNGFKIHMENINVFTIIKTAHELAVTDEVNKGFAKLDIIGGKNYEKVCEICHITLNKSAIFGDNGTVSPGGVRIGTPAMTSRGCLEADFETMADFLMRAAQIASIVQREHGKSPKDFLKGLQSNKDVVELRNRVESFASLFAMPAFDT